MNRTLTILVLLFSSSTVFSSDVPIPSDSDVPLGLEELAENTILDYLSEFSARRRLTTFFTNEQSPFYGAQINFVNVGKGNFTFLNRDLVRVDRMPIVLGRVYDSANNDRTDFGLGWKLTVAEEIRREGNIFRYTDSGNSEFVLTKKSGSLISDYPSLTGIEAGMIEAGMEEGTIHSRWIALRFTSGLTKVFERIGDSYKLVKVSNKNGGGIKLNYESGSLQSITSQNRGQVILHRNRDGLITSATDDHGRSVQFTYDKKGRLAEFTDLGGGEWAYGYDEENNLVSVIDPRGSTILNATYINGKTIEARILHDQMSFEYSKGNTRVSNSLNQEAVFWQHVSGLTEIAKGFGGDTTAVILNADLKPLSLDYNGTTVAEFTYSGSMLSGIVRRHDYGNEIEKYAYDQDRLTTVIRGDQVVADYTYDGHGRVIAANDAKGARTYRYHNDGRIQSISSAGKLYEVRTNSMGQIEQIGSDDEPWIGIKYNPQGSVSSIDRTFYGQRMPLLFKYDERGFRVTTNFNENGDVDTTYDAVGSLSRISYPNDGGRAADEYLVGENNELLEVKAAGKTGVRIEYDAVGRAINVTKGSRIMAVEYDQLSRVTEVTLNGSPFFERGYGTMDVDAVVGSDQRTSFTTVPLPIASSIFGSIDQIVYSRLRGAVYGPVRFDAELAGFVLHASSVPDQTTLASFDKRMLTPLGREFLQAPFTFDKPTNSLFIPPEYVSVNCGICIGSISSTVLGVSSPLYSGMTGTLTGTTSGICTVHGNPLPWIHHFAFGDGDVATSTGTTASSNHVWSPDGIYNTSDSPQCGCIDPFAIPASATVRALVAPPKVTILNADITDDEIKVKLVPNGLSGSLEISLSGGQTHVITTETKSGGTHTFSFGIQSLPTNEFTQVIAKWTVGKAYQDTENHRFRVLGNYRHSQYNTPAESSCTGSQSPGYSTNVQCTFTSTTYKSDFISRVNLNGSGHSLLFNAVAKEAFCMANGNPPAGATLKTFRANHSITGACSAVSTSTVAVNFSHPHLSCGDRILIVGHGVKTITDSCPGCVTAQLDNYTTNTACSGVSDLGTNIKTIKLL